MKASRSIWSFLAAGVSILLGAAVLAGWTLGVPGLVRVHPGFPATHPNTALALLVAGSALVCLRLSRYRAAMALGLLAGLLPALTLSQYLFRFDAGGQAFLPALLGARGFLPETRMGPYAALALALNSAGLFAAAAAPGKAWSRFLAAAVGGVAVAIGTVSFSGYVLGLQPLLVWSQAVHTALLTSIGLFAIGSGLTLAAYRPGPSAGDEGLAAAYLPALAMGLVSATLLMTQALAGQNRRFLAELTDVKTREIERRVQTIFREHATFLERMALRRELLGPAEAAVWDKEIAQSHASYPGFIAFAWSDGASRLHGVFPAGGIALAPQGRFAEGEGFPGTDGAGALVDVAGGGSALAVAAPFRDGETRGAVVGLLGIPELMACVLDDGAGSGYDFELRLDGKPLFASAGAKRASASDAGRAAFRLGDRAAELSAVPQGVTLKLLSSPLPKLFLAGGLGLSLLLCLSVYLTQVNRNRARLLTVQRDELRQSLAARAEAEAAAFKNQEMLRTVVSNAPLILYLIDRDFIFRMTMGKALESLGLKENQSVGKDALELYRHVPENAESMRRAMAGDKVEWVARNGDLTFATIFTPLRAADGAIEGIVGVSLDVTARARAEAEIRVLNAELEKKVEQRTFQLQEAVRELEAFSYSVSHDLRAPLRHIGGFVELLMQKSAAGLDDQGKRYLGIISDSAKRMDLLITHLLAFSRMSRQEIQKAPFGMRELVAQCLRDLEPDCAGRRIEWAVADLPAAFGDQDLIRQVVSNLLSNAVKFTKEREAARIEVGSRAEPGATVYFVRDNGEGFDMRYYDKLFGVFQRLHEASRFEGTGIGLANVRRIVARHGGKAWAEGAPGQGATFYFSLPSQARKESDDG